MHRFGLCSLIVSASFLCSLAGQINFESCGGLRSLEYIDVEGCRGRLCNVTAGEDVEMVLGHRWDFQPDAVTPVVTGSWSGYEKILDTPRYLCNEDCAPANELGKLPITIHAELPTTYPITVQLTFRLIDENDRELICAQFPVHVKLGNGDIVES